MIQCFRCSSENNEDVIIDGVSYRKCLSCGFLDLNFNEYEKNIKRLEEISKNTIEHRNKTTFNQQVIRLFKTVKDFELRLSLIENFNITEAIREIVRSELNE